jgi:hypothetical protein
MECVPIIHLSPVFARRRKQRQARQNETRQLDAVRSSRFRRAHPAPPCHASENLKTQSFRGALFAEESLFLIQGSNRRGLQRFARNVGSLVMPSDLPAVSRHARIPSKWPVVQMDMDLPPGHLLSRNNPDTIELHAASHQNVSTRSAYRERKYGFQNCLAFCIWQ